MENITEIGEIEAPYGKTISFKGVAYDNGFKIMRLRIKEGKRFTDMDLDVETVKRWQQLFNDWIAAQDEVTD